jgi:alpha-D-ribose 1-methylphosphonate 5-phosphate C-P lyase
VTAANGTTGITLPTGSHWGCIQIMSQVTGAANTLRVYGHNSDNDTINGAAADVAYVQMAGTSISYCTVNGTGWTTY